MSSSVCRSNVSLPWSLEVELFNGRVLYMAATKIEMDEEGVLIDTNGEDLIKVEKGNIRKILVMCSDD